MDFTERAGLEEEMDSLTSYAEYRECLLDLDRVSGLVLAHRATLGFLDKVATPGQRLRILDVACGDGDVTI